MALDLKSTIAQTEYLKNKTKTVATNIDKKLIGLGGEQAINLADVPNKIKKLTERYRKIAKKTLNMTISFYSDSSTKVIYDTNFLPKFVFISIKNSYNSDIDYINVTDVGTYIDFKRDYSYSDRLHFKKTEKGFEVWVQNQGTIRYTIVNIVMIG